MNKKYVHYLWTKLRPVKAWHLLLVVLISTFVSVLALRQNNLTMITLREAVYQADKDGGDVESALQKLRAHVHGHMNTSLATGDNAVYPPIQLKYTYQRLQEAAKARAKEVSGRIYTDAQNYCESINSNDFSGKNRIPCIEDYVAKHTTKEQAVPGALYKFDFVSPRWSFDVAGVSIVIATISLILLVLRVGLSRLIRHL